MFQVLGWWIWLQACLWDELVLHRTGVLAGWDPLLSELELQHRLLFVDYAQEDRSALVRRVLLYGIRLLLCDLVNLRQPSSARWVIGLIRVTLACRHHETTGSSARASVCCHLARTTLYPTLYFADAAQTLLNVVC